MQKNRENEHGFCVIRSGMIDLIYDFTSMPASNVVCPEIMTSEGRDKSTGANGERAAVAGEAFLLIDF